MHMKDNHMRNAQLKPGYNVQIGVDSEYIVAADSGYESEEGYTYLREQKQKTVYQTADLWKMEKRSFKQDISKRENMGYHETTNQEIPSGFLHI